MSNETTTTESELNNPDENQELESGTGEQGKSGTEDFTPQNWEDAFAAVAEKHKDESRPATLPALEDEPDGEDKAEGDDQSDVGDKDDHMDVDAGDLGRSVSVDGGTDEPVESEYTDADIEERVNEYTEQIEQQAINEIADMMLTRRDEQGRPLARSHDGVLGATLNDPDIYRQDSDGITRFYNPDTGRPFTGDNPRAQAKQWVDQYNEELQDAFNTLAQNRIGELSEELSPVIDLIEFIPTYDSLDPVRRSMLDGIIGDYEVFDNEGNHIGYSCDLNKALAQVNRQVNNIKAQRASQRATQTAPTTQGSSSGETPTGGAIASLASSQAPAASGPALDMKTGSSPVTNGKAPEFKSVAEAMEYEQNKMLEQLRKGRH